jgi:phage terminase large subunit GpA-like protein
MSNQAPYTEGWAAGFMPDPLLLVSEWADQHRKLGSKSSAEPGDWRTDRAPYAREPMDSLSAVSYTHLRAHETG